MIAKIFTNKLVMGFIFPFVLLCAWFLLSLIFNSDGPVSVLTYRMNDNTDAIQLKIKEIYKGQKVNGEFLARDNNLGIVSVRFNTFKRINDDVLIFRIKEKGDKEWFYENRYRVDQFQPDDLFTFGLPIIPDSKGKRYEFQLESTKGKPKDAVAISNLEPVFVTKYQFTKSVLLGDTKLLVGHIYKKFINTFFNLDFFVSSIVYLLPFLLYLLWIYPINLRRPSFGIKDWTNKKMTNFKVSFFLIIGTIFFNIFFVRELSSAFATLIILGSLVILSIKYKLDSSFIFLLALIFLSISPLVIIINKHIAELSSIWVYYFLLIGLLLKFFEFTNKYNPKFNYRKIFEIIFNK